MEKYQQSPYLKKDLAKTLTTTIFSFFAQKF